MGTKGAYYMKRFAVTGITRDKEYDLTSGDRQDPGGVFHGQSRTEPAEVMQVILRPRPSLRKTKFDVDFAQLSVKGRSSKGNLLTRYMVQQDHPEGARRKHARCHSDLVR
jgi:topoisomerase-4 subunit A